MMNMAGRKSDEITDRRQALLQAAADVFFEQGFAATSIDEIIRRAGGSKRNIYEEFGNKEGLFAAIVEQSANSVLSTLSEPRSEDSDLRATLTEFGEHLMEVFMSPRMIGIFRLAVTEARRFPELAETFYRKGPARATLRLAEVLRAANERGDIEAGNTQRAADHFIGMIRDNGHLQVLLGLRAPPSRRQRREAVRSVVDVFLNGVQARSGLKANSLRNLQ
jgi:AcrR family transcriptional regulator